MFNNSLMFKPNFSLDTEQQKRLFWACLVTFAVLVFGINTAAALGSVSTDAAGYTFYDILVNDVIKGPIGQAGGVFLMAKGAVDINTSPWKAGAVAVAGGCLFKAESIATSFGFPVHMIHATADQIAQMSQYVTM